MAERLPELDGSVLPTSEKPPAVKVKSPDLLSKFLAAREARPDFMTDTLVQTMAVSMAFAGSETTAISLSAVFYYLLKNQSALGRLQAELDAAAKEGRFSDYETGLVTWHESQTLPYLDACVKEAFRLHPAPGLPMERVVPEGGLEIAGRFIKGGTIVGCSAWVLHRNENIFGRDVDEYRPERWLPFGGDEAALKEATREEREKEEQRIKVMNGTMLQFGMGSRTCIGKNISLLEIYKLVPSMLRRFEVCALPPHSPPVVVVDFTRFVLNAGIITQQIEFDDPTQEWEITNAWFVKQSNFTTRFRLRELVTPEGVQA